MRKVAFVLYPDFTALDLVGPYEIISRWPEVDVRFVARSLNPVKTDRGLTVLPTDTTKTLRDPDLIVIPGSGNPLPLLEDHVLCEWLRATAPRCRWTASVCTSAGLYAAAGLLDGKKTSTHWGFRDNLRALGIDVVEERVVWQGTHVSAAGVSAGIDLALSLTEQVHGRTMAEALQLVIEYDPQPAFDSGSLNKASVATQRLAKRILLGDHPLRTASRMSRQILGARLGRARSAVSARRPRAVALQER